MIDTLILPGTSPFWIALLIVIGLGIVEIVSLLLGSSVTGLLDDGLNHHIPHGHDAGPLGAWASWINAGGVPLLVVIVLLLSAFSVFGFALQGVVTRFTEPLPAMIAALLALIPAFPATHWLSRLVARIIPREETAAIGQDDFIGLVGTVTLGPLDQGNPGSVRVKDKYDNIHTLRTQAASGYVIETGARVIIVHGSDGLFQAIPAPPHPGSADIVRG